MKRKKICAVASISFLLFLASCASSGKVTETTFDPSHPEAQSATVLFWLDIRTYNGIEIQRAWDGERNIPLVTIPAGESTFVFTAYFSRDYGRIIQHYSINDCEFVYNFEGGKEYTVRWFLEPKPKRLFQPQEYIYYVRIYDKLPQNRRRPSSRSFTDDDLLASIRIFDTEDFKR